MACRVAVIGIILIYSSTAHSELPSGAYDKLKVEAKEKLIIKVTKTHNVVLALEKNVFVEATVLYVESSATKLKIGDTISIYYTIPPDIKGPKKPPTLAVNSVVPAFLNKSDNFYLLAAHGYSFTLSPEN